MENAIYKICFKCKTQKDGNCFYAHNGNIEGMHRHHWSYNESHWLDIIPLDQKIHRKVHRYILYDKESKMYKTLEGTLLNTKELHEKYISIIKEIF